MSLPSTKRGQTENCSNYKVQFAAAMAKFNSTAHSALNEFLKFLMLLANISIDSYQHISILTSATKGYVSSDTLTHHQLLDDAKYEPNAEVSYQFDKTKPKAAR